MNFLKVVALLQDHAAGIIITKQDAQAAAEFLSSGNEKKIFPVVPDVILATDWKETLIEDGKDYSYAIEQTKNLCHGLAYQSGWDNDLKTGEPLEIIPGKELMLIVSEASEAMEGFRKNLMDDHLPNRKMAEVELADVIIRAFHFAGKCGFDLGGAFVEKLQYNQNRADHKPENRVKDGGKAF